MQTRAAAEHQARIQSMCRGCGGSQGSPIHQSECLGKVTESVVLSQRVVRDPEGWIGIVKYSDGSSYNTECRPSRVEAEEALEWV